MIALTLALATWHTAAARQSSDDSAASNVAETPTYMRVVDVDEQTMRLDMAVRFFTPPSDQPDHPMVVLASAIHIADQDFYELMQAFLDAQDLVLFEGVKPRGAGEVEGVLDDEAKQRKTEAAIRFIATMLERHKKNHNNTYPRTLDGLINAMTEEDNTRMAEWTESSTVDAWGHDLQYKRSDRDQFTLISYGSDGKPGGTGVDSDLAFADQDPLSKAELGEDPGIQGALAKALGLVFQLDAMNHEGANYRNSDMSIDQVEDRIRERGGDPGDLFKMIDGSSFMAGVVKVGLKLLEMSPKMQEMTKVTLIETMRLMEGGNLAELKGMPPDMATLFEVIIEDRNKVVINDLQQVLANVEEENLSSDSTIAIIYGAGHMADLEQRLAEQCGYQPAGAFWLPAMTVDLHRAGMDQTQLRFLRRMIKRMQPGL